MGDSEGVVGADTGRARRPTLVVSPSSVKDLTFGEDDSGPKPIPKEVASHVRLKQNADAAAAPGGVATVTPPSPLGDVTFEYGFLEIHVDGAQDILSEGKQLLHPPNPYVVIVLDSEEVYRTQSVKDTLNPKFGVSNCRFPVTSNSAAVSFYVCGDNPQPDGDDEYFGTATLPVESVIPCVSTLQPFILPLHDEETKAISLGVLDICARFIPGPEFSKAKQAKPALQRQVSTHDAKAGQMEKEIESLREAMRMEIKKRHNLEEKVSELWQLKSLLKIQNSRRKSSKRVSLSPTESPNVLSDAEDDFLEPQVSEVMMLHMTILNAEDLSKKDLLGKSDPYCVVLVDGKEVFRTSIVKGDINPVWEDQTMSCEIMAEGSEIRIEVWDHDLGKSDDFMGQVMIWEADIPLIPDGGFLDRTATTFKLPLLPGNTKDKKVEVRGDLYVQAHRTIAAKGCDSLSRKSTIFFSRPEDAVLPVALDGSRSPPNNMMATGISSASLSGGSTPVGILQDGREMRVREELADKAKSTREKMEVELRQFEESFRVQATALRNATHRLEDTIGELNKKSAKAEKLNEESFSGISTIEMSASKWNETVAKLTEMMAKAHLTDEQLTSTSEAANTMEKAIKEVVGAYADSAAKAVPVSKLEVKPKSQADDEEGGNGDGGRGDDSSSDSSLSSSEQAGDNEVAKGDVVTKDGEELSSRWEEKYELVCSSLGTIEERLASVEGKVSSGQQEQAGGAAPREELTKLEIRLSSIEMVVAKLKRSISEGLNRQPTHSPQQLQLQSHQQAPPHTATVLPEAGQHHEHEDVVPLPKISNSPTNMSVAETGVPTAPPAHNATAVATDEPIPLRVTAAPPATNSVTFTPHPPSTVGASGEHHQNGGHKPFRSPHRGMIEPFIPTVGDGIVSNVKKGLIRHGSRRQVSIYNPTEESLANCTKLLQDEIASQQQLEDGISDIREHLSSAASAMSKEQKQVTEMRALISRMKSQSKGLGS